MEYQASDGARWCVVSIKCQPIVRIGVQYERKKNYTIYHTTLNTNATIIISTFKNEIFLMLVHSI
jgi:hypothetical protein